MPRTSLPYPLNRAEHAETGLSTWIVAEQGEDYEESRLSVNDVSVWKR